MAELRFLSGLAVLVVAFVVVGAMVGLADVIARVEVGAAAALVAAVMVAVIAIGAGRRARRNPYW